MSEHGSQGPPPPITPATHIDEVCDDFERACRAGRPAIIEEFLLRAPPGERDRLLAELLEIELDCRQRTGTFVDADDYRVRFPDRAELVDSVFRRVVKTRRLGDYELLEELGRGGMGTVYKARQVFLNQVVAVKILPRRGLDDPQAVNRFLREMQSIGALGHPNIVRAYNAGSASGVHFLVMEYVDGISLQRFVGVGPPQGGLLGIGAACEIVRQAAAGLQHAYEHQLVHRDIKPANLMLAREGQVKILDLGLAKLHSESRGDDRLTLPGATMGTVDYMAPEQWENSAAADIRADIYSLGCTLFFLLTGKPPYGAPDYDSSRKKLMAHAVAAIPPLRESCADVPEELEEVYEAMLAKKPEDRYSTPAEVAEAVAEFADAEELAEIAAALPPHDVCVGAENTGAHGPGAITPPQRDSASGSSPTSGYPRRRSSRWASRQKFRRNVTIGIAAGLTAVAGSVLVWSAIRPHGHGLPSARSTGFSRNLGEPPKGGTTSAVSREAVAADLALLPGLNGGWWFDEMPWLTPFVRQAIADKVLSSPDLSAVLGDRPQAYLNANTVKARQWLWQAAQRCRAELSPCQQKLMDQLKALSDENHDDGKRVVQSLQSALQQFADAHSGDDVSAVDRHTIALMQHAIAAVQVSPQLTRQERQLLAPMSAKARSSYLRALQAYAMQPKAKSWLQPLCLFDSAVFAEELRDDIINERHVSDELLAEKDLPPLFHVSALVQRGRLAAESAASAGEFEDYRFVYAKKLLDGCQALKPVHPLAACIAENYAASLLDQWKVDEAIRQFQAAYHVRLTNQEEKDPSAAVYVFRDRLGSAVANRYRGNVDATRRACKNLAGELRAAIEKADHNQSAAAAPIGPDALRDQLANTLEAWGDCELYGGAASGGKVNLVQAADRYNQGRLLTADAVHAGALGSKLLIVRRLNNDSVDPALRPAPGPLQIGAPNQRARLLVQLADAMLAAGPAPKDERSLLRAFLDQFKLNPSARGSDRREVVEMCLFAAEMLVNSDLAADPKSARRDLKYLDALLALFQGRRDVRPYLRRFYELAVEAYCTAEPAKIDLVQIAHYVLDSRMAHPQAASSSQATLLIFSFTPKANFALFLPQDGRPGKRFELGLTRDQVKTAKGKPPKLNDELAALVNGEVAAHRPVELFWDDAAAWPSQDQNALTDGDWPFGGQLDMSKLNSQSNVAGRPAP